MQKITGYLIFFLLIITGVPLYGQLAILSGRITDGMTGRAMTGVNVVVDDDQGTTTGIDGSYRIVLTSGRHHMEISYLGYETQEAEIELKPGEEVLLDFSLRYSSLNLDEFVVSASRYKQRQSEIPVSISVIRPSLVTNTQAKEMEEVLQRTPGVMMMDGQASIRGGSGYAYGTGSRVLLLVDDLPMMTGASGEAKWQFLPIDGIDQVEVIKGASSVLYGSSALNGIVHVRTAWPDGSPGTSVRTYSGIYGNPAREEIKWWGNDLRSYSGAHFIHSRKIGKLEVVAGIDGATDNGYKEDDNEYWYNGHLKMRVRSESVPGLEYGFSSGWMEVGGETFLLWEDGDTNVLLPAENGVQAFNNKRLRIDPFIQFLHNDHSHHSLRGRYFMVDNRNDTEQNNKEEVFFAEYQYAYNPESGFSMVAGANAQSGRTESQLYGASMHTSMSLASFIQLEKRIRKLTLSGGARWEWYQLDDDPAESKPVFRLGLNYPIAKHTFLRASFGQGFRYPSVAEKYTLTQVSALKIFPNPDLSSEYGWSTEAGIRQNFRLGTFEGFADLAVFRMEYQDMIEFTFGQHYPDSITNPTPSDYFNYTGFRAFNIGNTRITGVEMSFGGRGQVIGLPLSILAGYTYSNPIDLDFDPDSNTSSTDKNILKYRFYHNVKFDAEVEYRKLRLGAGLSWNSDIINIDKAFEDTLRLPNGTPIIQSNGEPLMILPGLHEYRLDHGGGILLIDLRIAYQLSQKSQLSLSIKNLLNREYIIRPGDVQAPRNFSVQYHVRF